LSISEVNHIGELKMSFQYLGAAKPKWDSSHLGFVAQYKFSSNPSRPRDGNIRHPTAH
jgi:hypothetical protein